MSLPSFEHLRDEPGSPFFEAPGRTPEATWAEITRCLAATLAEIHEEGPTGLYRPCLPVLTELHRRIFATTFPSDAGRLRATLPSGEFEHVEFGISVGTGRSQRVRPMRGAHPRRIEKQVTDACNEFDSVAAGLADVGAITTLRTATNAFARLYGKLLRIHPFVDGNLRAAYATLQCALTHVDLPMIEFHDAEAHDAAVDVALRVDRHQSYRPMSELIEGVLKEAQ
jgi:fido (protein-threonine AMPylation protein)